MQLGINKETGQEVAIKTIKKSKIETEADLIRIRREVQIMSSVQHPNIIHIYEGKWAEHEELQRAHFNACRELKADAADLSWIFSTFPLMLSLSSSYKSKYHISLSSTTVPM